MTVLLLVRHAAASGQEPECSLTDSGREQAKTLANLVKEFFWVDRLVSSPFNRALQTAEPISEALGVPVVVDERLQERLLYRQEAPLNWKEELKRSFDDFDYRCGDGETNGEGMERVQSFLRDLPSSGIVMVVSHGNWCALLLSLFSTFGFAELFQLSNPDFFAINIPSRKVIRCWSQSVKERHSARAILLDEKGERIFLFEVVEPALVFPQFPRTSSFWITPGGGVEDGENIEAALERELWEELGLCAEDYLIEAGGWTGRMPVSWQGCPQYSVDNYRLVRLKKAINISFSNHSEHEQKSMVGHKWWTLSELKDTTEVIIPQDLKSYFL